MQAGMASTAARLLYDEGQNGNVSKSAVDSVVLSQEV